MKSDIISAQNKSCFDFQKCYIWLGGLADQTGICTGDTKSVWKSRISQHIQNFIPSIRFVLYCSVLEQAVHVRGISKNIGVDEMMGEMVAVICGVVINYVQQEETNKVLLQKLDIFNIQYLYTTGTEETPVSP